MSEPLPYNALFSDVVHVISQLNLSQPHINCLPAASLARFTPAFDPTATLDTPETRLYQYHDAQGQSVYTPHRGGGSPRLVASSPKRCRKRGGITIFHGRLTGAVASWLPTTTLKPAAGQLYALQDLPSPHLWCSILNNQIPIMPDPIALLGTPNPLHAESGTPARCLECSLNVIGISVVVHDSWAMLETALAKYQHVLLEGTVTVLPPPSYLRAA
ncbi:hypothetical protein C8R43DRAFT_955255 [Mycena crocata]|nr:hypothetical protein C8R43DRAFT_955255 [Mycena crocata]